MTQTVPLILLIAAAWTDWKFRKIPNVMIFPFMLGSLVYQFLIGRGWVAVAGIGMGFLLTLLPVAMRGMGMGDQKLLMAIGAWTGHSDIYTLFLYSIYSCLILLLCSPRRWRALHQNVSVLLAGWNGHRAVWLPAVEKSALSIPYAVHLLLAYILFSAGEGKV